MRARWRGAFVASSLFALPIALVACGSRSGLRGGDPPPPECEVDDDCVGSNLCDLRACVDGACESRGERSCRSTDPCEVGTCEPETGECSFEPNTPDSDEDGHRAPLPGFVPGAVGSCGDDCDDTRGAARPGGSETCDGVDNDCDGVVDNGSTYLGPDALPTLPSLVQVASPSFASSARAGVAFGLGHFALGYWAEAAEKHSYLRAFRTDLTESIEERRVTNVNVPSFGADLAWSGSAFGAVWADTRSGESYDVYFARFDAAGEKLAADLAITERSGFSVNPQILYDQGRFVVVFDDDPDGDPVENPDAQPSIYAQRLTEEGERDDGLVQLSDNGSYAEYPSIAALPTRFGVAYTILVGGEVGLGFRSFDKRFGTPSSELVLAKEGVRSPRVIAVGDVFVVTWDEFRTATPGEAVQAAVVSFAGDLLVGPTSITSGATFARSHSTLSLGDRFLLVWADDLDGNYELYGSVLAPDFAEIEPRRRLTDDPADTVSPALALSDEGRIGIFFDDYRSGHDAYFTTLGCPPSAPNPFDCSSCTSCSDCPTCCRLD